MIKKSSYNILEYFTAFFFFLVFRPSFTWSMNHFFILIPLACFLLYNIDIKKRKIMGLFVFFFLTLAIIPLEHGASLLGFLFYTVFAVIPFMNRVFTIHIFGLFRYMLATVTAISLIVWFMVIILRFSLPYSIIPPLNDLKTYDYLSYPFLVVPQQIDAFFRFSCMFDEAGTVGTYSLLMLYIDGFNIKKWYNIVFLVAGLTSLSLFFYISFVIFILLRVFTDESKKKFRFWTIVGIISLFAVVQTSPLMYEMIGSRMEYDDEKNTIAGNDRSGEELDSYIASIRGTGKYFWGDNEDVIEEFSGNASLNNAILRYGFVFMVMFFLFYFIYARYYLKNNYKELLFTMLLLFLTLYQRPAFADPAYIFIFTMTILSRSSIISNEKKLMNHFFV